MYKNAFVIRLVFLGLFTGRCLFCHAQDRLPDSVLSRVDQRVESMMKAGNIPGLSLVLIRGGQEIIRSYGLADRSSGRPVTTHTLFELGSCSKAFTSIAVLTLEAQHRIRLDSPITAYIPWLWFRYKDNRVVPTVGELLHHTTGIPWNTISGIPISDRPDALERTIRNLVGLELNAKPGSKFEYVTINYDVLALMIQYVTGKSFEEYVTQQVIGPLRLAHTSFRDSSTGPEIATGYKIGFFRAREYRAPPYRGNDAAGYIVSDAVDMQRWLRFQMGQGDTTLYSLAKLTHERDETVAVHGTSGYGMGWEVSLRGDGEIYHGGVNPNYSAFVAFRPAQKTGVVILDNSNSGYTPVIGDEVLKIAAGEETTEKIVVEDRNDKGYSITTIAIGVYILIVVCYFFLGLRDLRRGLRRYQSPGARGAGRYLLSLTAALPFLAGLYLFPQALAGVSWGFAYVWSPVSFDIMVRTIILAIGVTYLAGFFSWLFPAESGLRQLIPKILLISMLSGISNMILILLVTSSLSGAVELGYLIFYFCLCLSLYIVGRWFVQLNLIRLTWNAVYEIRMDLFDRIFATSFQRFEQMDRGRVFTVINEDVAMVGESANTFVMLATSVFTAICAFAFLATIAFWATIVTVSFMTALAIIFYYAAQSTNKYFEAARDTRNVFLRLTNGVIDGFKELSMHRKNKQEYKADVGDAASLFREKTSIAGIRFLYAFLLGETLLSLLLGSVSFVLPELFPDIPNAVITSFVIVLLYLIGPINRILGAIPAIMQLKVAWKRIKAFRADIPSNLPPSGEPRTAPPMRVKSMRAEGIVFRYREEGRPLFEVGPIDLQVNRGEILFIVGANGSGKTTLAKLITGLYEPEEGTILIDEEPIAGGSRSEYFSTVFNPAYLFSKLYNVDVKGREEEMRQYLELLGLENKLTVDERGYSTLNLSGGQRKRMALLQCYLENAPIYLFDEWAADQDPEYRRFFYRKLLPDMKKMGKIVIAITHDDNYFDVADRIVKMKEGKMESLVMDVPIAY